MPTVRIPAPLRHLTTGRAELTVSADDLATVIAALETMAPGIGSRLVDADGRLQPFVHIFVGDQDVRSLDGLQTPVDERDLVTIVPAVAGGGGDGHSSWRRVFLASGRDGRPT